MSFFLTLSSSIDPVAIKHLTVKWGDINRALGHLCAHIGLTGRGEPPEDDEMTLSYRHMIRNSRPGGLRPSTLPLGHGGPPQYWLSHLSVGVQIMFGFSFSISTLSTTFKRVEDKAWHQSTRFENTYSPFSQIFIISLTWSCGSRQRDTTSSEWKFKFNNLAVKVDGIAQLTPV